jgi:hypothetical protein
VWVRVSIGEVVPFALMDSNVRLGGSDCCCSEFDMMKLLQVEHAAAGERGCELVDRCKRYKRRYEHWNGEVM